MQHSHFAFSNNANRPTFEEKVDFLNTIMVDNGSSVAEIGMQYLPFLPSHTLSEKLNFF